MTRPVKQYPLRTLARLAPGSDRAECARLLAATRSQPDALGIKQYRWHRPEGMTRLALLNLERGQEYLVRIAAAFQKNFGVRVERDIAVVVGAGTVVGAAVQDRPSGVTGAQKELIRSLTLRDALATAGSLSCDFGVVTNFPLDEAMCQLLATCGWSGSSKGRPLSLVAAPGIDSGGYEVLMHANRACVLAQNDSLVSIGLHSLGGGTRDTPVRGGAVRQQQMTQRRVIDLSAPGREHGDEEKIRDAARDIVLAWALGSVSRSHAIVAVRNGRLYAAAAGAPTLARAGRQLTTGLVGNSRIGLVAYSDSGYAGQLEITGLWNAGIRVFVCSYGTRNDEGVIEGCAREAVPLVMLPRDTLVYE